MFHVIIYRVLVKEAIWWLWKTIGIFQFRFSPLQSIYLVSYLVTCMGVCLLEYIPICLNVRVPVYVLPANASKYTVEVRLQNVTLSHSLNLLKRFQQECFPPSRK